MNESTHKPTTDWLSAQDIAAIVGLTKRTVERRAQKDSWAYQRRKGRGGGNEYSIRSLPTEMQKKIRRKVAKHNASYASGQATAEEIKATEIEKEKKRLEQLDNGLRDYIKVKGESRTRLDARHEIMIAAEAYMQVSGEAGRKGMELFCRAYNKREIELASWVHETKPKTSPSSLYDWFKTSRNKGFAALDGNYGHHRKGTGIIDTQPPLTEYIIGMIVEHPHISGTVLLKAIKAEFNGQLTLPSQTTLERWVAKWKNTNKQVYTAVTNPDAWKNKYMAAPGSASEQATALNTLWEFDATPADMMLTDGRYSLSGVIDVYSRRLKLIVTRTSNSKAVAQVIRSAIIDWGVPEIAKTDNGADYKSKYIKAVFKRLEVDQQFCPPFQGWKKPHIERAFRTFSHDIAELLPGFIGHNVSERKAIEARKTFSDRLFQKDTIIDVKMSSLELQAFCDKWVDTVYHRDVHDGLKKTPLEMVREWKQPIKRIENERILDVLLSEPAGTRTITKKGIKLDNGIFIHASLWALAGEEVQVYYDDRDMGRIYVYDGFGEFLCIAEDPDITGVSRSEVAAKAKEVQREAVQEERRRLRAAARKVTKRDVAQDILAHREQEARKDKTIEFPKRSELHSSDDIDAAKATLAFDDDHDHAGNVDSVKNQIVAEAVDIKMAQISTPISAEETDEQLYIRWRGIDTRHKTGEALAGQEESFYKSFPTTAEYKVMKKLEDLGMYQFTPELVQV